MLKINQITIRINTTNGLYGVNIPFSDGLNIIRGHNSSGKSTIFQAILYCLGMEELIGGKNEKSMQSVLKDEVMNDQKIKEATVIESSIVLEIENKRPITIERYVKSEHRDSRLVTVYDGALLSLNKKDLQSAAMYVHDPGAASDVKYGFQAFLEKFLGLDLPHVQYNDNSLRKLYLQNIFPAFVIEQKAGWSDFLSTIPYYNLKDKEKRGIEFILKLDSWRIEEAKQEVKRQKQELEDNWTVLYHQFAELARRSGTELNGLTKLPSIVNDLNTISLTYLTPETTIPLASYTRDLKLQLMDVEEKEIPIVGEISQEYEAKLAELNQTYRLYSIQYDSLNNQVGTVESNIGAIQNRLRQIQEELYQNKQHLKLKKFGAENNVSIAIEACPACGQELFDALLSKDGISMPMNIEENIGYLTSQRIMAESYIEAHKSEIESMKKRIQLLEAYLSQTREKIRAIKRDLISDERMPSVETIEERIKLKNRVTFYESVQVELAELKKQLLERSSEWSEILKNEKELPSESFSKLDYSKVAFLKNNFIRLLQKFDYASKTMDDLDVSKDKLIPVANGNYSIKFDSSASDLMRAIFAFTCSLFLTSEKYNGNHPKLIMLDEPGGQDMAVSTLRELFLELQNYNAQSLVFASFKQSESDFQESTKDVTFNLINSEGRKFIRRQLA